MGKPAAITILSSSVPANVSQNSRLEAAMEKSGWIVGEAYSIADIAAVPFVKRIDEEIAPDEMTAAKHPRVARWWAEIQARPAFDRARIGPFLERD